MLAIRLLDDKFVVINHFIAKVLNIELKSDNFVRTKVSLEVTKSYASRGVDATHKDLEHDWTIITNCTICRLPTEVLAL